MRRHRSFLIVAVAGLTVFLMAPPAFATPVFNLDIHHHETNFIPGSDLDLSATTVNEGAPPSSDEVQQVTVKAGGGEFQLTFGGQTTEGMNAKSSAATVQAALNGLSSIGGAGGSVTVSGGPGDIIDPTPYLITFGGALGGTDVTQIAAAAVSGRPLGGLPEYWFDVTNVGDTATSGTITLTINLPGGITRDSVRVDAVTRLHWSCPGSPGATIITCTTSDSLPRHTSDRGLMLAVDVHPGIEPGSVRFSSASVSGGGAATASAIEPTAIDSEPAGFGIVEESFLPDFLAADGLTPEREAGAHPDLLKVPFDFNTVATPLLSGGGGPPDPFRKAPEQNVRHLDVDLPPGFLGDPTAVGECTAVLFTVNECPVSSQVGRIDLDITPIITENGGGLRVTTGVFNLSHPRGAVSDLGFVFSGNPVHIKASLDPANAYAITTKVTDINETLPAFNQRLTLWGVPADHSHDSERCPQFSNAGGPLVGRVGGDTSSECATDLERKAFLTLPSRCDVDHAMRLHHYDSWLSPGEFGPDITHTLSGQSTDCDRPRFEPQVQALPTGGQASTPTGFDVKIKVPQNENPNALATPPIKRAVVTLPEGMSFSPSFADGLQSCTPAQIGLFTNDPVKCPDASRIGEVEASTPLLPKATRGSMYLAAQGDNPFHSTFALYMALEDTEERGALVKIPGRIDVDPVTGQITTVFDDLPQFPVDEFALKFRSGPRAPLISPPICGEHEIGVRIASYARPAEPVDVSNAYEVTEGPGGTPCPTGSASRPFTPEFSAGTLSSVAGRYATFLFGLSRDDAEQELSRVTTVLPPGLVAKIAGIPFCSDVSLASISEAEGAGWGELSNPACPQASQVGTISAGLGAGPGPNYFGGKVYLAGPYKGAPLSLAIVTPGLAGPFDLGNVVVRAAIQVDSENAQVRAVSDRIPTILHGVILRVRDVRLRVDRPQTTINPTSCDPMSVLGEISGAGGSLVSTVDDSLFSAASPFKVGSCSDLSFAPKLSFRLFGGTKRGAHPKLRAVVRMPEGGANIARASVALPRSEFLDQSHIGTVCTRVQFAAKSCPADSIYGFVKAKTPLLDETLSGPIYLRSSDNPLPDLVAAFRGGRIDIDLVGRIDSVNQGIRNTFDIVPDAPVSWAVFTFRGGKKGLLVNSRDLCKKTYRATARFTAHSGRRLTLRPVMRNSCTSQEKGKRNKRPRAARR